MATSLSNENGTILWIFHSKLAHLSLGNVFLFPTKWSIQSKDLDWVEVGVQQHDGRGGRPPLPFHCDPLATKTNCRVRPAIKTSSAITRLAAACLRATMAAN